MTTVIQGPPARSDKEETAFPDYAFEQEIVTFPLWKRTMDIAIASTALILAAPIMLLVALVVPLDSRGGPIFRQHRVGHGGRMFTCLKFRSMYQGADRIHEEMLAHNEAGGQIFKMKEDPRRTRAGKILRKTSLDELPQLFNVLRGDMTIVGPRPPLPSEVVRYQHHEFRRLAVKPGITGLWQVTLRGRHDFADMVALDARYADEMSLWLDIKILFRTIPTVLFGKGAC